MDAVVIGGSAGSTAALATVLPALPVDFCAPILVVVHLSATATPLLAELLTPRSRLPLQEAEDKMPVAAGTVYLAPPDYHLLVEADAHLSLSVDDPVFFSRPSIDVLFESAAEVYGSGLVAILLSGANEDGARGLALARKRGGHTIVQDPATAPIGTMPAAAIRLGAAMEVLTLDGIIAYLNEASERTLRARAHVRSQAT
jgi:two-component system chemotaxis response regulator CheB